MKQYKNILFSAMFSLLLSGLFTNCSQTGTRLLKKAYRKNSTELLNQFFAQWQQATPTITDAELATYNDTVQEAYKVFKAFYKPNQLDSIGGSEWGNDVYKDAKYLIVQNGMRINFTDTIKYYSKAYLDSITYQRALHLYKNDTSKIKRWFNERWTVFDGFVKYDTDYSWAYLKNTLPVDTILNFRPQINCGNKIPLYHNPQFTSYIYSFLKNSYYPLSSFGISNAAQAKGESAKKKEFLENFIKIFYGHWGGYWQLESYPVAYNVTFDKNMKSAVITYRMIYEGGSTILKKIDGHWKLVESKRTWME